MITENNKIIAEFLGWQKQTWSYNDAVAFYPSFSEHSTFDLKFHSDWNWLIEVVEKIESLGYIVSTHFNSTDIKNLDTLETICYNRGSWKQYTPPLTKIESVYNACVEFIKWYNEQKE